MKKFLIVIIILGVLGILAWLLYVSAFNLAFQKFGPPKEPPPLFTYETAGRVERLENAMRPVMHQNKLTERVANGNKLELRYLTLMSEGDRIEYEFYITDCQSFYYLVAYNDDWNCSTSHLGVMEIKVNGLTVSEYTDKNVDRKALLRYQKIFEEVFFNKVKTEISRQPQFDWGIEDFKKDSITRISVNIFSRNDTANVVTRHTFRRYVDDRNDTFFRQTRTERYFQDTTVLYLYDSMGVYIDRRITMVNAKELRQDY